ncbi:AAA family ATPase [Chromobacterium alticapitis]|nr:AAA family ATPase [Chromobacterium alticapitis]
MSPHAANHINPDHFLHRTDQQLPTPEQGKQAWALAYAELERQLLHGEGRLTLCVVCGLQGSGKSSWVRRRDPAQGERMIFFDAALPSPQHRGKALDYARSAGSPAIAVWLNAPLPLALARNAQRPPSQQVPETIIHHTQSLWQPPQLDEGFSRVIEVDAYHF